MIVDNDGCLSLMIIWISEKKESIQVKSNNLILEIALNRPLAKRIILKTLTWITLRNLFFDTTYKGLHYRVMFSSQTCLCL